MLLIWRRLRSRRSTDRRGMKNVPSTGMWGGPRRLSGQTSGFESGIKYAGFGALFRLSVSWRSQGVTARRCENPHVSPEVFWTVKRGQMYGFCGQMCGEFVLKKVVCLCFDYRTGRGTDKINGPGRSPFLPPAVDVGLKPHSHPNGNNKATATATATARGCCALFCLPHMRQPHPNGKRNRFRRASGCGGGARFRALPGSG